MRWVNKIDTKMRDWRIDTSYGSEPDGQTKKIELAQMGIEPTAFGLIL